MRRDKVVFHFVFSCFPLLFSIISWNSIAGLHSYMYLAILCECMHVATYMYMYSVHVPVHAHVACPRQLSVFSLPPLDVLYIYPCFACIQVSYQNKMH